MDETRLTRGNRSKVFAEFQRWGFDSRGWSPVTRDKYTREVAAAERWLVEHRGTSVLFADKKDLQAYLFSKVPTAGTRNRTRQALIAFWEFMVEQELVPANVAKTLPRLPEPQPLPSALSPTVAKRLEAMAATFPPFQQAVIYTLLYTGMRREEARTLQWAFFDEGFEWVRFHVKSRGGRTRQRELPVHPKLQPVLTRWKALSWSAQFVFPSPRYPGRPLSERQFYEYIRQVGEDAGIKLYPHLLRHTAATALVEAGANLREVQEFLGHANLSTTAIYTRVRPVKLREAVSKLTFERSSPDIEPMEPGNGSTNLFELDDGAVPNGSSDVLASHEGMRHGQE